MPDAATYKPKPIAYQLFEQKVKTREFNGFDKNRKNKKQRFNTDIKSRNLGPGKYNIIH